MVKGRTEEQGSQAWWNNWIVQQEMTVSPWQMETEGRRPFMVSGSHRALGKTWIIGMGET